MRISLLLRVGAAGLVGLSLLAACGDDNEPTAGDNPTTTTSAPETDHPDGDGAREVGDAVRRLAVTDADSGRLVLIDLDGDGAEEHELELPEDATYTSSATSDGRYLLLAHDDAVTIVDGGTWIEPHGDHSHHFIDEPSVLGTVDGAKPTHLISHGGTSALWFDGLGEALLFDEKAFEDGELPEGERVASAGPHHGFAIAHHDHVVMTAPPATEGDMPEQVVIADRTGATDSEHTCLQTHGEASWTDGAAAACADGVLLLREDGGTWSSQLAAYPQVDDTDPYGYGPARAWLLQASADGKRLVAPLGEHHVLVLDTADGSATAIDVGAPVETFGVRIHEPSGLVVVLTGDGALQLIDPEAGAVVDRIELVDAQPPGPASDPYRMVTVSGNEVFVSEPTSKVVHQLELSDEQLLAGAEHSLGFTPSFVAVLNG